MRNVLRKNIVPQPGTVQARVLAALLTGETEVSALCSATGLRDKQVRGAIDALLARGWDIAPLGDCNFRLNVQSKAA